MRVHVTSKAHFFTVQAYLDMNSDPVNVLSPTHILQMDSLAPIRHQGHLRSGYKSWRKKYRKLKLQFEEKMRESNNHYVEQHKAVKVAKRLQEQNDQLLELLLDINDSIQIPVNLRYALNLDSAETAVGKCREMEDGNKVELHRALREARAKYDSCRMSKEDYLAIENDLVSKLSAPSIIKLSSLLSTPHSQFAPNETKDEYLEDDLNGRMTPNHEEDYLNSLDSALSDGSEAYRMISRTAQQLPSRGLSEKDLVLQNPNSVYHWLKKHQPQIFNHERDLEGSTEKPAPTNKRLASKRGSDVPMVVSAAPRDNEIFDDDTFYVPEPPKSRRTKDDEPYRPKGGSSKPAKRKREEGERGSNRKKAKSSGIGVSNDNEALSRRISGDT